MNSDPWLTRWLSLIAQRADAAPILEIGCGGGDDTCVLVESGLQVVGFDKSAAYVAQAKAHVPQAIIECRDVREPFPLQVTGVVIASLSLHYFSWQETVAIVARIRDVLHPGGVLVCRLNSTDDHHWGASGHPAIEPDYYRVGDECKRFFDEAAIRRLFADGWRYVSLEHYVTQKYPLPKAVWEIVVEKCSTQSA